MTQAGSLTFGERAADFVAANIGRWAFVIAQTAIIAVWMWWNAGTQGFDPYPFILLNLVLSLQAAYTGPVLLISSNRADALRSQMLTLLVDHTERWEKHSEETHQLIAEVRADNRRVMAHLGLIEAELEG